jgi:hypothetical protein
MPYCVGLVLLELAKVKSGDTKAKTSKYHHFFVKQMMQKL